MQVCYLCDNVLVWWVRRCELTSWWKCLKFRWRRKWCWWLVLWWLLFETYLYYINWVESNWMISSLSSSLLISQDLHSIWMNCTFLLISVFFCPSSLSFHCRKKLCFLQEISLNCLSLFSCQGLIHIFILGILCGWLR